VRQRRKKRRERVLGNDALIPLSLNLGEEDWRVTLPWVDFIRWKSLPCGTGEGADSWLPLPPTLLWSHPKAAGEATQGAGSLMMGSPAPQLCGQLAKKELWVISLLWSGCHGDKLLLISSVVTMAIF
jgi:hypothetical protein